MKTGTKGLEMIKSFEGCSLKAYYDSVGVLTIGYGHTNNTASASKYPVTPGMVITQAEAETILREDLISYENSVNSLVHVNLTQNQFDALVSFTYNLGAGTLSNSDLLVKLNGGDYNGSAAEFERYVHAGGVVLPGLVRRPRPEKELFLDGTIDNGQPIDTSNRAIEVMIQWMNDRKGKVSYSMDNRNGPNSYDCSSAVYHALVTAGFLPEGSNGNTDTLFNDLERNGWMAMQSSNGFYDCKRGDIFIWGIRGNSTGAFGHTGIFVDNEDNIIHCNYAYNGITINNHDVIWAADGKPHISIYRFKGDQVITPNKKPGTESDLLIPYNGVFYPNKNLAISADTTVASAAIGYYKAGDKIIYDAYTFNEGYAWISYVSANGSRNYIAVGPDDGRTDTVWGTGFFDKTPNCGYEKSTLISHSGVFIPNTKLAVSPDPTVASPALDYYESGMSIYYDSYMFNEGYAWISYLASNGERHYIAVGPDDGRNDTVWGTGFFDNIVMDESFGNLKPLNGVFYPNKKLAISGDATVASPALGYYEVNTPIIYDSYIFNEGYAWISYLALNGERHYIAVGPDDGRTDTVWGSGFFNDSLNVTQQTPSDHKLISLKGVFTPNTKLAVSPDPTVASPALDYYESGMSIYYDSYMFNEGYAWISYLASNGERHYIAVGPDDGSVNTVWGSGFFN